MRGIQGSESNRSERKLGGKVGELRVKKWRKSERESRES